MEQSMNNDSGGFHASDAAYRAIPGMRGHEADPVRARGGRRSAADLRHEERPRTARRDDRAHPGLARRAGAQVMGATDAGAELRRALGATFVTFGAAVTFESRTSRPWASI